jgi:Uma2 family endonuclease
MANVAQKLMTADEFLTFAEGREGKWELHDGVPVCMSPERVGHSDYKYRVTRLFDDALAKSRLPCRFIIDGPLVRISDLRCYQPDMLIYCGNRHPPELLEIPNPLIVVEVLSPSTASYDLRDKLRGYFQVASIMHYLIVDADQMLIIHHRRGEGDEIATRFVTEGILRLDPPGLELDVAALFAEE